VPVHLIHGDDEEKLDGWRARPRARHAEDPSTTLEVLRGDALTGQALAEAITALTLSVGRRYVLADGVERWKERDVKAATAALADVPQDTVVVLIAADKVPAALLKAVEKAGGKVQECKAPTIGTYPGWAVKQAHELGFELDHEAAEVLIERAPREEKKSRIRQKSVLRELEKLAVYAGEDGKVTVDEVDVLTHAAVNERIYELADAVIEGDPGRAVEISEKLSADGEPVMHILFGVVRQVRQAKDACAMVAAGKPQNEIQSKLGVPPFIAKRIVAEARGADPEHLEHAIDALAELDYAIRGGSDHDEGTAVTLALARAAGATL